MGTKIKTKRKGLGPLGTKLMSELGAESLDVFSVKDAESVSGLKGKRLRKLLHDLMKNKWINRIERGKYLVLPLESGLGANYGTHPFIIARKLAEPYYIGFASALNYYGITEQIFRTVYIASLKRKRGFVFHAENYYFVTLAKKRFFGFTQEWIGKFKFNISDKEKTIIDCLFLPEYSGGLTEVIKAFKEKLDYEKLYEYAVKMNDLAALKRLGYLLDILKIKTSVTKKLLNKVGGGYCWLDTHGPKTGIKNRKWKIIENISAKELKAEL